MATIRKHQIQTVDDSTGEVIEILHPETQSDIVSYVDTEPVINAIGGVPAGKTYPNGTVQQVLYDILHPYVKPLISLSANPDAGVREKGTVLSSIALTATVTKKSSPIRKVEFLNGSTIIGTNDSPNANGGDNTYNYAANLKADAILKARVTDQEGSVVTSSNKNYTFVYPLYIGYVDESASTPTQDQIKAMEKRVVSKSNQSFTYNIEKKRFCIACPPGWTLSKILDPNSFDVTASFVVQSLSITGLDGTAQTYTVYVSDPTTQSNFVQRYNI